MKTLRVTLADIIGPTGTPNSTATVHARYVDTSGRGRDVHLTDGTIVVPVRRVASPDGDPEVFDFDVYANDVAPVREVDYGHLVEVSWTVVAPTGAKTSGVRRVAITDGMASVVQLGLLSTPTPVPPYTGGYSLPGHKHVVGDITATGTPSASTYLRGDGSWSTPAGGGGGGAVDSVNGETGVVVLDAADVGADPAGTAAGLVGALIIPDSPDDIGAATAAQGALADTAVQPAALAAHEADTTAVHGIADTSALVVTTDPRLSDARTPTAHTHDDRYFTETEADGRFVRTVNGTGPDGSGNVTVAGGGGGVTDHGALTGLGDDDHTQYALADGSRGTFAAPLGADDNYVTDAEKASLHAHSNKAALDLVSGTNTGDQVLPTWSTISGKPAVIAAGVSATAARTAIGAGTSSLAIGTTGSTAAAGNRAATETATGMVELATTTEATTGTDTVRAVTPAGVKAVADTKANVSHTHTASQVSDSTTTGRALLTAADAAAARTALSLGDAATKNTGTTAGTLAAGDDSRIGKIGGTVTVSGTPTAGQVPIASSGTAAAWGTPSGGSALLVGNGYLKIPTGRYAHAWGADQIQANTWTSLNEMHFVPLALTVSNTFSEATVVVGTAQTGASVRLGIYSASASTGFPDTLIQEFGTVSATTTGQKNLAISGNITLAAGLYWMTAVNQSSGSAATLTRYAFSTYNRPALFGESNAASTFGFMIMKQTGVTGALPSSATPVIGDQVGALISLKAA